MRKHLSNIFILFCITGVILLLWFFKQTQEDDSIVVRNKGVEIVINNKDKTVASNSSSSVSVLGVAVVPEKKYLVYNQSFTDNFNSEYVLEETGSSTKSASKDWWVNSGAFLYVKDGVSRTIFGKIDSNDVWRKRYYNYNASETDNGYHPQNIFRLVTRSEWKNYNQSCYYRINKYILSKDSHRMESNGLLLFNRYQDGYNLYYTGIRVDGSAIIKKKINGVYFKMTENKVYPGKYDRSKNPNFLPLNTWIGLRSEVKTESDGTVDIKVYLDKNRSGKWELVAEAKDDGKTYGGKAILTEGYAGIRTDFMDVEFDDYKIEEIK